MDYYRAQYSLYHNVKDKIVFLVLDDEVLCDFLVLSKTIISFLA